MYLIFELLPLGRHAFKLESEDGTAEGLASNHNTRDPVAT